MGISSWLARLAGSLIPRTYASDQTLDAWVRDALREDAASPPPGAWERLRRSILDRSLAHRRGMWVLDEPLRDPPEPGALSERQLAKAQSLLDARRAALREQAREVVWSHLMPPFAFLMNV